VDEQRFPAREAALGHDRVVGGDEDLGDGCRLPLVELVRDPRDVRLVDDDAVGKPAASHETEDAIARLPCLGALPEGLDGAGNLEPGDVCGHARRRRIIAAALEDVRGIDAREGNPHENLAGTGSGVGPVLDLDYLVSARACENDCLHTLIAFSTADDCTTATPFPDRLRAEFLMSTETTQPSSGLDVAQLESLYERMLQIRLLEDAVHRLFLNNEIEGTTHLYQGQEAVAVGVCDMLKPGDTVAATYRGHGAALALGVDQTALLGEFLGRENGTNGGRGGSMNVISLEHGLIGCFGIVGGSIAAATGAALASQLRKDGTVAVAFFGDGATNQAYFHECLNFAGVRALPIVFVCENNLYGEWTSMFHVTAGHDISARAAAYGMPALEIDGNDVLAVREAAGEALERARSGQGPTLLECKTYRHKGHSRVDAGKYRPKEEVEEWLQRDPLPRLAERLDPAAVERIQSRVEAELELALSVSRAAATPDPDPSASAYKE